MVYSEGIGWWYVQNSQVIFNYTALVYHPEIGFRYCLNGQVLFDYTGLARWEDGSWWYLENGGITYNTTVVVYSEGLGWWYVQNSQVIFNYTGIAHKDDGSWWYVENGYITLTYTGTCEYEGVIYNVVNSQVIIEIIYQDIDSNTVRVASYSGSNSELTIPETYNGKTVVEIGSSAFENHTELTSIDLPDTITVIGARAFAGCSSLSSMT